MKMGINFTLNGYSNTDIIMYYMCKTSGNSGSFYFE